MKEYLRSPIMLFFTIAFPVIMFFIFQLIKIGTGVSDEIVPMFTTNNLTPSITVFSLSFLALNLSTQISRDRNTSFQSRLCVSPMKPIDFFLGYFLPSLLIAISQIIISMALGLIFGMTFNIGIIYNLLALPLISVFYISLGILIGSIFSEKSCGGIASIVVNMTAIFSGMFFPLVDGTFKNILSSLPFLPSIAISQAFISGNYDRLLIYIIVLLVYTVIAVASSTLIFKRKLKNK